MSGCIRPACRGDCAPSIECPASGGAERAEPPWQTRTERQTQSEEPGKPHHIIARNRHDDRRREKKRSRKQRTTRRVPLTPFLAGVLKKWLSVHTGGGALLKNH